MTEVVAVEGDALDVVIIQKLKQALSKEFLGNGRSWRELDETAVDPKIIRHAIIARPLRDAFLRQKEKRQNIPHSLPVPMSNGMLREGSQVSV